MINPIKGYLDLPKDQNMPTYLTNLITFLEYYDLTQIGQDPVLQQFSLRVSSPTLIVFIADYLHSPANYADKLDIIISRHRSMPISLTPEIFQKILRPEPSREILRQRLLEYKQEDCEMTTEKLAEEIGISKDTLNGIFSEKRTSFPSPDTLAKIANATGISKDELCYGANPYQDVEIFCRQLFELFDRFHMFPLLGRDQTIHIRISHKRIGDFLNDYFSSPTEQDKHYQLDRYSQLKKEPINNTYVFPDEYEDIRKEAFIYGFIHDIKAHPDNWHEVRSEDGEIDNIFEGDGLIQDMFTDKCPQTGLTYPEELTHEWYRTDGKPAAFISEHYQKYYINT